MKISDIKKEELELMSYNDITEILLSEKSNQTTAELFKQIVELLSLPASTFENKVGDFYTSLTTDKRFLLLDSAEWDLRDNHSVKIVVEDDEEETEEEEIEEEQEEIEEEEDIDANIDDDDLVDDDDDMDDLAIVDEEEEELDAD